LSAEKRDNSERSTYRLNLKPNILSSICSISVPEKNIEEFAGKIKGKILIYEDGDRFLEEKIRLLGINAVGKEKIRL
jgi:TPP-dependent indolepyruvate ferredoxin oxidoreductase alpha subunit